MLSLTPFYPGVAVRVSERLLGKINDRLWELSRRLRELEERREAILEELSKLKPERGTLERKPVKNKLGYTYHYWYLRKWENGKLRSIYLGAKIPESLFQGIQDRNRARKLQRELKEVEGELCKITTAVRKIEDILSSL